MSPEQRTVLNSDPVLPTVVFSGLEVAGQTEFGIETTRLPIEYK
jgi:hypothetical protein